MSDISDREIMKRVIKWRNEAEAREKANAVPKFKPLAEVERGIKATDDYLMEHAETGGP